MKLVLKGNSIESAGVGPNLIYSSLELTFTAGQGPAWNRPTAVLIWKKRLSWIRTPI